MAGSFLGHLAPACTATVAAVIIFLRSHLFNSVHQTDGVSDNLNLLLSRLFCQLCMIELVLIFVSLYASSACSFVAGYDFMIVDIISNLH